MAAAISEGIHAFWWIRGRHVTGRYWLQRVLAGDLEDPVQRAWLLVANARLAVHQGAFDEAETALDQSEAAGRSHHDDRLLAAALSERVALGYRRPVAGAEAAVAPPQAIFRRLGDVGGEAELIIRRGSLEVLRGDHRAAVGSMVEALALMRAVEDSFGTASALSNIGYITALDGHFDEALTYLEESRQLFKSVGSQEGLANVVDTTLALVMTGRGEFEQAIPYYERSIELFREMNYRPGVAFEQVQLGRVRAERGEHAQATACLQDGLRAAIEAGVAEVLAFAFDATASLLLRTDRPDRAAELYAGAGRLRVAESVAVAPVDQRRLDVTWPCWLTGWTPLRWSPRGSVGPGCPAATSRRPRSPRWRTVATGPRTPAASGRVCAEAPPGQAGVARLRTLGRR